MTSKFNQGGLIAFFFSLLVPASCGIASIRHPDSEAPKPSLPKPDMDDEIGPLAKLPSCDLGSLRVEASLTISPLEHCPSLSFTSLSLAPGSALRIEAGVKLLYTGESETPEIEAPENSTLIMKGESERPVSIIQPNGQKPLKIRLGGSGQLEHVKLKNSAILAWSKRSEKSLSHLEIDNSSAVEGTSSLGCLHCRWTEFKDVSILVNAGGRPLDTTPLALMAIKAGELQISGVDQPYIQVSGLGSLWGIQESASGRFVWPNLGYPYRVNDGLTIDGDEAIFSPGLSIEFCESCALFINARKTVFGDREGESVTLRGIGSQTWAGVSSGKKLETVELNSLVLRQNSRVKPTACPSQSAHLAFAHPVKVVIGKASIEESEASLLYLTKNFELSLLPEAASQEPVKLLLETGLSPYRESLLLKLVEENKVIRSDCKREEP